MREEMIPVD